MNEIAAMITNSIKRKGMTLRAVAEKAGMSVQHLSAFINGRRKLTATELIRLCRVLGITQKEIMSLDV